MWFERLDCIQDTGADGDVACPGNRASVIDATAVVGRSHRDRAA